MAGEIISQLGSCPAPPLPDSSLEQACDVNWKDVRRFVFIDKTGTDPFTDGAADYAAVLTNLQTQSVWSTAIQESTTDTIYLTPKISNYQMPLVQKEATQLPDQTYQLDGSFPSSVGTGTFYSLNSENEEKLMLITGTSYNVLFIDFSGNVIHKRLTDAEVADGKSVFFDLQVFTTSTRQVQTGAGELDQTNGVLTFAYDALVRFEITETTFGLVI